MRNAALFLAAAMSAASLLQAQEATPGPAITGADELVQKKGALASTWVRPDADISRYSKLYLWQPEFQFREGGETKPPTTTELMRGASKEYAIRPEDQERFKQLVSDQFVAELARGKLFEVVDVVGPDTLIVRAGFLDITSDVPPNVERYGNIHLASVGEATIVFELIDASTGVIQARAAERQQIQPEWRNRGVNTAPANSATVWSDVERWAREQAQDLRQALEKAKRQAEKKAQE
jgi:hypothetical protein